MVFQFENAIIQRELPIYLLGLYWTNFLRFYWGLKGFGVTVGLYWTTLDQLLAEREGFEPPIPVKVCLISSQVHSTALPSLRALFSITYDTIFKPFCPLWRKNCVVRKFRVSSSSLPTPAVS
jgi:hypothetical protein